MSRTENVIKNIKFTFLFQILSIGAAFLSRKVFVMVLSKEYLGLEGTFSNILSMISLAELGIGSAITYSMYKPIATNNQDQILALLRLYKEIYLIIGLFTAVVGFVFAPFLPKIIRGVSEIQDVKYIFLLYVINASLSYFYGYKQALIVAYQHRYITSVCKYGIKIILLFMQAVFLWYTKNYIIYIWLQICATLIENVILSFVANRMFPYIQDKGKKVLESETKKEIIRNTKAMLMHKIGGVVVAGTDNLLMAAFVGVTAVGFYSNYLMVVNGLNSIYTQFFRSLVASVGNLRATKETKYVLSVFQKVNFACGWLYGFSAICLFILLNPFLMIWVGKEYLLSQEVVFIIAANFYISGMRQSLLAFVDACGLYWHGRYKPLLESCVNLICSIVFARLWGIAGVLLGTLLSSVVVCLSIEPRILFKYGLNESARSYFTNYLVNTVCTFLIGLFVWYVCDKMHGIGIVSFCIKSIECLVLANAGYLMIYARKEEFLFFIRTMSKRFTSFFAKEKKT